MPKLVECFYEVIAFTDDKSQNSFCEAIKLKKGKIIDLDYKFEFNMTQVTAHVPIHNSYGLYLEILKATSGKVIPQIKFGGWRVIDQDPFYEENLCENMKEIHGEAFKIKN